jgi:hypothetical protein
LAGAFDSADVLSQPSASPPRPIKRSPPPPVPPNPQTPQQGTEDDAFRGASPLAALSRAQRLLLLSDGSVTRHLQIVLGAAGESAAAGPEQPEGGGGGSGNESSGDNTNISSVRVECLAMDLLPSSQERDEEYSMEQRQHHHHPSPPPPERDAAALLRPPLLRRQVLLRAAPGAAVPGPSQALPTSHGTGNNAANDDLRKGAPLVYATSWWNASDAAAFLGGDGAAERPIWAALTSGQMELHRRVLGVERGANARLWSPGGGGGGGGAGATIRGLLGADGDWGEEDKKDCDAAAAADAAADADAGSRALWGRHYVFWANGRPLTVIYEVFSPRLMAAVDETCGIRDGRRVAV